MKIECNHIYVNVPFEASHIMQMLFWSFVIIWWLGKIKNIQ